MRFLRCSVLAAAILPVAAPAAADPDDLVTRPLVLDEHAVELRLVSEINIQPRRFAEPLSLSPEGWWGISPRWTIGLIHSDDSVDQIDAGATFCVREGDVSSTCHALYRGSGIDVRYGALAGQFSVAPRARLFIRDVDPFKPAMTLGALVRWTTGRFAIVSDPNIRLPLANGSLGNRSQLNVPLWFELQPATGWLLALRTGYEADFAVFDDGGYGALALAVTWRATPVVDVGLQGGWASLLGPQHDSSHATVVISADWRL